MDESASDIIPEPDITSPTPALPPVPPFREKRKILAIALGAGGLCLLAYWKLAILQPLFFGMLSYAQAIGSLMIGVAVLLFKDWESYKTHKIRFSILCMVILFSILSGVNQYRERQERNRNANAFDGLRNEVENLRHDAKKNIVQTTQAIDALRTEVTARDAALEKLGKGQLAVSEKELALQYEVSVDVIYGDKKFQIFNKGKSNISLWGTRPGAGQRLIEKTPRMISPGGSYYLVAENWEAEVLSKLGRNAQIYWPLELYLKDGLDRQYVLNCTAWIVMKDGNLTVHMQNVGAKMQPWLK